MLGVTGAVPTTPTAVLWWVLTPDGDVYPEEVTPPGVVGVCPLSEGGRRGRVVGDEAGDPPRADTIYGFTDARRAGPPSMVVLARALVDA
eukprot:4889755-Lingulodinium_polyedra.AAC.1